MKTKSSMNIKSIKVSEKTWLALQRIKLDLRYERLSDVIDTTVKTYINQKKKNEKSKELAKV